MGSFCVARLVSLAVVKRADRCEPQASGGARGGRLAARVLQRDTVDPVAQINLPTSLLSLPTVSLPSALLHSLGRSLQLGRDEAYAGEGTKALSL